MLDQDPFKVENTPILESLLQRDQQHFNKVAARSRADFKVELEQNKHLSQRINKRRDKIESKIDNALSKPTLQLNGPADIKKPPFLPVIAF